MLQSNIKKKVVSKYIKLVYFIDNIVINNSHVNVLHKYYIDWPNAARDTVHRYLLTY